MDNDDDALLAVQQGLGHQFSDPSLLVDALTHSSFAHERSGQARGDNERLEYIVQGDVSDFISASNFKVRGEVFTAASATYVGGTPADLANGRRVHITASAGAGALIASAVTFVK